MTRINDFNAASVTDTRSAFLWAVSSNKDYSVSVFSAGDFMRHRLGAMLVNSTTGQGITSGTVLGFNSAYYDPDGWFNSNSVGLLRAPNDKVTHASFRVGVRFSGVEELQLQLFKNGSNLTGQGGMKINENPATVKTVRIEGFTGQIEVSSGDRFEIKSAFQPSVNSMLAHGYCSFTVIPERFKA